MNRIVLGLFTCFAIVAAGCSSSSTTGGGGTGATTPHIVVPGGGAVDADKLIGVWKLVKINGQPSPKELGVMTFEFAKNGKAKFVGGGKMEDGTYKLDGNKITLSKKGDKDDTLIVKNLTATGLTLADDQGKQEMEFTK